MGSGSRGSAILAVTASIVLSGSSWSLAASGVADPPSPPIVGPAHLAPPPAPPGCPPACEPLPEFPPPRWYGRVKFMALRRDADREVAFAAWDDDLTDEDPAQVALSTRNLDFPYQGGGEALIGYLIVPTYYLEFSYFGVNSWDELAAVRDDTPNAIGGTGSLFSPFGDFGQDPLIEFDYNHFASLGYESRLNNFELNLRHDLPMPPIRLNTSFLFGGVSMLIDEDLRYVTEANVPNPLGGRNQIDTSTDNRLLGLQVGGLFQFHIEPRWWIDFRAEGAICQNKISLDSVYTNVDEVGNTATYITAREASQTAFVGDLALSLICDYSQYFTARIGYRALWMTGLALAAENFPSDPGLLKLGPPKVVDDGEVVYHGPHVGITVRW